MNDVFDPQAAYKSLYLRHWSELVAISADYGLAHAPFLMCPPAGYLEQRHRLLIVGQESNDDSPNAASGLAPEAAVSILMDEYLRFNFGATYRGSPFWQAVREVENMLRVSLGQILWTNLNKVAPAKGPPPPIVEEAVLKRVPLLQSEIELAKPDVVVFFSGPNYDRHLLFALPGVEFTSVDGSPDSRVFCRLIHPCLPKLSFRTYHPGGLRQTRQWTTVMSLFAHHFELG